LDDFNLKKVTDPELAKLDGLTAGTATASKVLILGANKNVDVLAVADLKLGAGAGTSVTSTAAEINTLALSGITNADLVKLHAVTASKDEINTLTSSGVSNADLVKLRAVTATAAEIDKLASVTAGAVTASKALVVGASKDLDELKLTNLKLVTGTPVNAVNAYATLTFTGAVSDTETITIGADVYEFDTNSSVTPGNIAVDVSGGATAPDAVTALVAAITTSGTEPVSGVDGTGDTVVVTADVAGVAAESILVSKSCTNAS
jgi:hypothetical protein